MPWIIFVLALAIRIISVWPNNFIFGFDQARDFFNAAKIWQGHLAIIGPTAGNNPNLHHGVAWVYFIALPILLGQGNPMWVVIWNFLFNALSTVVIYFLAKSMFGKKAAIISGLIAAVSFYFVSFAGWLSNPTLTLLTVPLFFYGFWQYYQGRTWGLPLCFLFLGLSIQLELFFIYLIPTFIVAWLVLHPKLPSFRVILYALCTMLLSLSTMIATEVKLHFAGVMSILSAGQLVGGKQAQNTSTVILFLNQVKSVFSQNLFPGSFLLLVIILVNLKRHKNLQLLLIYLLSPTLMLLLGYKDGPWFLIGLPPAICLLAGYVFSLIPLGGIIPIIFLVGFLNLQKQPPLLERDRSAVLANQIAAVDYTYQSSGGQPFAINTVTNPLYINAVWAWDYQWYSQKFDYLPSFAGGDQLPPYDVLPKSGGQEKIFYLIVDESPRIPPVYTQNAESWAKTKGKLIEEKEFNGIKVEKYQAAF